MERSAEFTRQTRIEVPPFGRIGSPRTLLIGLAVVRTDRQYHHQKNNRTKPQQKMTSPLDKLQTPSLLMDVRRVRRNAERMSALALENGVRLRPHIKTHKCVEVARIATEGHSGAVTASPA